MVFLPNEIMIKPATKLLLELVELLALLKVIIIKQILKDLHLFGP